VGLWPQGMGVGWGKVPVVQLSLTPKLNAPEVELVSGVTKPCPKPPLPAGAAEPLNVKGDRIELPSTELLVPILVLGGGPEASSGARLKEKFAAVRPKVDGAPVGAPQAEVVPVRPP
jgi:hypothetical protein